jgi:hypothetical protein
VKANRAIGAPPAGGLQRAGNGPPVDQGTIDITAHHTTEGDIHHAPVPRSLAARWWDGQSLLTAARSLNPTASGELD